MTIGSMHDLKQFLMQAATSSLQKPLTRLGFVTLGIACLMLTWMCRQSIPVITGETATPTSVRIVHAPDGSFVPDVAMDVKGTLHRVYAQDKNAYYQQSTDNGATFTHPVQVNSEGSVEFKMGERGPKLSVGRDGIIHVVWMDCWAPDVKTFVRYTRSLDGGKTFEKLKTLSSKTA